MKIRVNGRSYDVQVKEGAFFLDDRMLDVKLDFFSKTRGNLLYQYRSYDFEIVEVNKQEKTVQIKIKGRLYQAHIEDPYDLLLKQMGMQAAGGTEIREVKAPMPGLVLDLLIEEGMEVRKDDGLLVLEAMKMENVLKSPTDGVIKSIKVSKGDKVEKGEVLVQFQ